MEDVSNFDEEFTTEKAILTPPQRTASNHGHVAALLQRLYLHGRLVLIPSTHDHRISAQRHRHSSNAAH